jgi:hypothetical protein
METIGAVSRREAPAKNGSDEAPSGKISRRSSGGTAAITDPADSRSPFISITPAHRPPSISKRRTCARILISPCLARRYFEAGSANRSLSPTRARPSCDPPPPENRLSRSTARNIAAEERSGTSFRAAIDSGCHNRRVDWVDWPRESSHSSTVRRSRSSTSAP